MAETNLTLRQKSLLVVVHSNAAEGERFELSEGKNPSAVFETAALVHYATPPN